MTLLDCTVIEKACEDGYHWYDLGVSTELPGVETYKMRLGAKNMPGSLFKSRSLFRRSAQLPKKLLKKSRSILKTF
jgi:CelD/BcsL family acetyltransferase involved in cellulose biosynthesis